MRDRDLVRLYWPVELRPAFDALFGIDDAMADVVASSTQPALGAIRLAWWREALERLDSHPPPSEPRLEAAARELLPRGITGADLAKLERGWAALLDEDVDWERLIRRGEVLFESGTNLLGASDPLVGRAGRLWARQNAVRRRIQDFGSPDEELHQLSGHRFPRRLRPLTALASLAARDLRRLPAIPPEATPGRAATLLWHRLFGIVC